MDQLTQTLRTEKPCYNRSRAMPKKTLGIAAFFLSLILAHVPDFFAVKDLSVTIIFILQGTALTLLMGHGLPVACATVFFCVLAIYAPQQARSADAILLYIVPLGALLGTFAYSLLPSRSPLISRVAQQVHGPLRADIARYTRYLTMFWAAFFALALLAPAVLAFTGPYGAWRWPLSGGTFGCAAGIMVIEACVRRLVIRNFDHVSLKETVSAFRKTSAKATSETV